MIEGSKSWCTYRVINLDDGKMYIGKTNDMFARWNDHVYVAEHGSPYPMHRAIHKYGMLNFLVEMIEEFKDERAALDNEKYWIAFYKTNLCRYRNGIGYNLTDGGEGISGFHHSDETKQKLSLLWRKFSTEEMVRIIDDYITGLYTTQELASKYDCSRSVISYITSGKYCLVDLELVNEIKKHNVARGGKQSGAFSDEVIRSILDDYKTGTFTTYTLSEKYTCHPTTIGNIINGKYYDHIDYDRTELPPLKETGFKNRNVRGENVGTSKLTDEEVLEIRRLCSSGVQVKEVAKIFGIHRLTAGLIKNGKSWKHVK